MNAGPTPSARLSFAMAGRAELEALRELLASNGLPHEDVGRHLEHFVVARDGSVLVGAAGVEVHGPDGLLRSVCVSPGQRGRGLAAELCDRVEAHARSLGVRRLYLLTTTAEAYFARRGFTVCSREAAPRALRETEEFRTLCPATAVCLTRGLEEDAPYLPVADH